MLTRKQKLLIGLASLALLAAVPLTGRAQDYSSSYAELYPTEIEPLASGWAEWQEWDVDHRPPLRPFLTVEVEDVYSTERVKVLIHRSESTTYDFVGLIQLTDGSGYLMRRTWYVNPGDEILIVDEATDVLLLWGIFE
jgi:hypothetical protein